MNYTNNTVSGQESNYNSLDYAIANVYGKELVDNGYLILSSGLPGFRQTSAERYVNEQHNYHINGIKRVHNSSVRYIEGEQCISKGFQMVCSCGFPMSSIGKSDICLLHLPTGSSYTKISIRRQRFKCNNPFCKRCTYMEPLEYKASGHLITSALDNYARALLSMGLNLKEVSHITGINKNAVKDIDKTRLEEQYTITTEEGIRLKKPDGFSKYIGIDEFKLHNNHKYATVIADLETGHVLFLALGKKKSVVKEFIKFVGMDWMGHVVAVGCDMNSDFEEEFKDQCPWINIVFDYFHIVKNFNDKVIGEVRKDEQRRLIEEGNEEAARDLKGSKYVLTSSRSHLKQLDKDAKNGKVISRAAPLFGKSETIARGGYEERYNEIVNNNKLLFTCDIVKEMLRKAYSYRQESRMRAKIEEIADICRATENKHFIWFAKLLENHIEGIVTHAKHQISSGKLEGINNRTKTIRRQCYGIPDDDYFFLKIIDASYQENRYWM